MKNGLVTVVLPIYNVELYLDKCIQSVVDQTYSNLEILLIDDGSPDNCPKICDEWALKDDRIRVIHKQNEGLGMARNTGIENATGEYICFFDSDDYIAPETIENTYSLAANENAEIVVFGFCNVDFQDQVFSQFVPFVEDKAVYAGQDVLAEFFPDYISSNPYRKEPCRFYMSPCMMLYSTEMISRSGWRFVSEREIISEDIYSLLSLFQYVNKVAVLPEALYYYRVNNASLSRSYRPDRYLRIKHFYLECLKLCERLGYDDEIAHRVSKHYLGFTIAAMKQECAVSASFIAAWQSVKRIAGDDVLHQVLKKNKKDVVDVQKRILFFTIRNKLYFLSTLLLMLKARKQS